MRETELWDVPLPSNTEAERLILGSIILDDSLFQQVVDAITADDFSIEKHRRIFSRMKEIAERGERIDRVTLANELMKLKQLESVDGVSYIVSLDEGLPELTNLDGYVRIVQDKSVLRQAAMSCATVLREALSSNTDSGAVVQRLHTLTESLRGCLKADEMPTAERVIIEAGPEAIFGTGSRNVIPSPWPRMNQIIGGFEPGQMVCVGARPSMGKTVMACQIALSAAELQKTAVIFSLEMSNVSLVQRFVATLTSIPHHRVRGGGITDPEDREAAALALNRLCETQSLFLADRVYTIPAIRTQLSKLSRKRKIDLVVIDYLQLITSTNNRNRVEQITEISRGVKLLAQQFECAVVVTSQLSRESEKESREPRLSDLRDSGSIEQDCDLVIFPHRISGQDPEEKLVRSEFIVAKQRNGRLGRIPVVFQKPFVRFVEA